MVNCKNCSATINLKEGTNCKTCGRKFSPPGATLVTIGSILLLGIATLSAYTLYQMLSDTTVPNTPIEQNFLASLNAALLTLVTINLALSILASVVGITSAKKQNRAALLTVMGFASLLSIAPIPLALIIILVVMALTMTVNFVIILIIIIAALVLLPSILYIAGAIKILKHNKKLRKISTKTTTEEPTAKITE